MPVQKITVTTEVPLPPEEAWRVYTDPSEIIQWNFATDEWHCPTATTNLEIGGLYKARMEAKDGSFGFDFEGIYTEVDAPRALTILLGDGRQSRTTFQPSETGTVVTTMFDAESENPADMQQQGWQAILSNYQKRAKSVAAR